MAKNIDREKTKKRKRDKSYLRTPKRRFSTGKRQAIERGKVFTLTYEEFVLMLDKPCYYCNDKLKKGGDTGMGLDRLDNAAGYWAENVVPCCWTCNRIRSDALTPEEAKAAIKAILKVRNKR